jgi:hypothetical protein
VAGLIAILKRYLVTGFIAGGRILSDWLYKIPREKMGVCGGIFR